MKVEYHPQARVELFEAIDIAEDEFGTGEDLRQTIESAENLIETFPRIGDLEEESIRRYVISDYPFSIIYGLRESKLVVLAIMHDKREPGYWKDRKY
ncbi:MAG: type II toxin-antitoxin system RelE/ParE family toxin [bacterium]